MGWLFVGGPWTKTRTVVVVGPEPTTLAVSVFPIDGLTTQSAGSSERNACWYVMSFPVPATGNPAVVRVVAIETVPPATPVPDPMSIRTDTGVWVGEGVGVAVAVTVADGVGVPVCVGVGEGELVGVSVGVGVCVGVSVGVEVGATNETWIDPSAPTTGKSGAPVGSSAIVFVFASVYVPGGVPARIVKRQR
ncbi:MAG: hypothetical protein KatS3mg011_2447 [Acidimicrobiia bacterium]|nr:MAG: hypothetical protein KatS3mg011_2447 [Acidimicrobiia bacterium]